MECDGSTLSHSSTAQERLNRADRRTCDRFDRYRVHRPGALWETTRDCSREQWRAASPPDGQCGEPDPPGEGESLRNGCRHDARRGVDRSKPAQSSSQVSTRRTAIIPARRTRLASEKVCREIGLGELLDRMPWRMFQMVGDTGWQLSHGERSRLFVARALLQKPDLLILDESFAALDPDNFSRTLDTVERRAAAVLVIAHP